MNQVKKNHSDEIASRMQLVIKHLGGNVLKIGKEIGANKDTFSRAVRSGTVSKTVMFGLSDKFKINPLWLMKGTGNMIIDSEPKESNLAEQEWKDKYIACIEEKNDLQKQIIQLQHQIGVK
jgi:hypothetical protein